MEKQQMTRRRLCAALYVVATLVTAGLFVTALCRQGVTAFPPYVFDIFDILGLFPPLFVGIYLLWRAVVYLFCTSERTVRRMALTVLYGLLGLGMLVFPFDMRIKANVKWWLVAMYASLRGIEAFADMIRSRKEEISRKSGRRKLAEGFFILVTLTVVLFVVLLGASLWAFLFPKSWTDGFLLIVFMLVAPPLLLAVCLLRKCVLDLSGGTGGKAFPFLYGGIAVGIFVISGRYVIDSSLPWVLVCVYGAVQAVDTLLKDVRRFRAEVT